MKKTIARVIINMSIIRKHASHPHEEGDIARVGVAFVIQPVESVRDILGVLIDGAMTLTTHVNHFFSTCFFQLRQIRIIRRSLTTDAAHSLVRALIHARIDYCNGLLASCPKYLTDKLQSVLRAAARLVLQLPNRSSVTDLMHQQLHWLDIQSRVRYKIGLLVYKCLHGLAPQYLSDYCVPVQVLSTRSSLRSARFQERLLVVPRTKTKTIGPRGFFHASPTVWNSLPDDLRDPVLSIGCFRNKLKTFLFSKSNANANYFFFVVHLLPFNFNSIHFAVHANVIFISWRVQKCLD